MKILLTILILTLTLTACGAEPVLETIGDVPIQSVSAPAKQIIVDLPDGSITPAAGSTETGQLYICDDYVLTIVTAASGDLKKTVLDATGYTPEELQIIKTVQDTYDRYDTVWTAAGEEGQQIGRLCILDDGSYHYVLTAMTAAEQAGKLQPVWQDMFSSFRVTDENVNTGS